MSINILIGLSNLLINQLRSAMPKLTDFTEDILSNDSVDEDEI